MPLRLEWRIKIALAPPLHSDEHPLLFSFWCSPGHMFFDTSHLVCDVCGMNTWYGFFYLDIQPEVAISKWMFSTWWLFKTRENRGSTMECSDVPNSETCFARLCKLPMLAIELLHYHPSERRPHVFHRVSPMAPRILFRISRIPWSHPCCCVPPFLFSSSKTWLLCLVSFLGMRTQPIWERPSWMTRPSTASETGGFNISFCLVVPKLSCTLWWTYKKQWKMAIEIVDFPWFSH